jgi:hydroxymethylpyrimidine pyrophosphatase-like HAD family hydrolase
MPKTVSFDYDGVLTTKKGADTLDEWLQLGDTIYIITARNPSQMESVYNFAKEHGILKSRVINVKLGEKWHPRELDLVRKNTDALAWSLERL